MQKILLTAALLAVPVCAAPSRPTGDVNVARPTLLAQADAKATTVRLDDLVDGKSDWKAGIDRDATATLEIVKDQPEPGKNALRFAAEITSARGSARLKKELKSVTGIKTIRMKVKSETATVFGLVLVDETGQVHQKKGNRLRTDGGWTEFVIDPLKIAGGEHWGGANDGQWHGQISSLTITYNIGSDKVNKKPVMLIGDITAEVVKPAAG